MSYRLNHAISREILTSHKKVFHDNTELVENQQAGYRNGEALKRHIAQHGGKIDPECNACAEIQRKSAERC